MPKNSMPAPGAAAVCSPIRRSRSAGSSVARAGGGCGKTSTGAGRITRLVWPTPLVHSTVTVPMTWRPQARGRSTHRARAGCPATTTWVAGSSPSSTAGPGSIRNVTSSIGVARVAMTSTSSPSKQRDGAAVTVVSRASGRVPRRAAARAARAGAPASSRLAWRVRTAATMTTTAIVASRRSRGAACQLTGCPVPVTARPSPGAGRPSPGACSRTTGAWVIATAVSRIGPGNRLGGEDLRDHVLTGHPADPHLGPQHQPVRQGGDGDRLDVLGDHVVAGVEGGVAAGELDHGQRAARARPDRDLRMGSGRGDQADDVAEQVIVEMDLLQGLAHGEQGAGVEYLRGPRRRGAALQPAPGHLRLPGLVQVAQPDPGDEPVQLCLRKGVGAFVFDRVVGRQHDERLWQRVRLAVHADLALGHGFQEGCLRLRRGAVDLVAEQQVGEDGPWAENYLAGARVEDRCAGEVGGQHVRGELNPGELQPEGGGEGTREQGLAQARQVLDEDVPGGQDAEQDLCDRFPLADDDPLNLGEHLGAALRRRGYRWGEGPGHSCSSRSTIRVRVRRSAPGALLSNEGGRDGSTSGQMSSPTKSRARAGSLARSTRWRSASTDSSRRPNSGRIPWS